MKYNSEQVVSSEFFFFYLKKKKKWYFTKTVHVAVIKADLFNKMELALAILSDN